MIGMIGTKFERGIIERIADVLIIIKNNPDAGKYNIVARANVEWHIYCLIKDMGLIETIYPKKGKRHKSKITEKGKEFMRHYNKLYLLVQEGFDCLN